MDPADLYQQTFRIEADELIGEIEAVILLVEEDPENDDAINRLFRAVHTLKGSGAMFGLTDIANFSHGLESVLDKVRSRQLSVSRELIDLTLAYRDQVAIMLHVGDGGVAVDADRVADIKRRLAALCPFPATVVAAPQQSAKVSSTLPIAHRPARSVGSSSRSLSGARIMLAVVMSIGYRALAWHSIDAVDRQRSIEKLQTRSCSDATTKPVHTPEVAHSTLVT
jgi:chemotaxis protein histidine kinase CheA